MARGSAQSTTTEAIGPVSRVERVQHAELVALRVGHDRPWDVALAYVGECRAEILQARDQLRLMGRRGRGEVDMHAVLHRLGFRGGDEVDADGDGVGIDEALGFEVGHAGSLAGDFPAEHLRPETAQRGVVKSLHVDLHKPRCHVDDASAFMIVNGDASGRRVRDTA